MNSKLLFAGSVLFITLFIGVAMISPPANDVPVLPATPYEYKPPSLPNFIDSNDDLMQVDDNKATLGRVIFYDKRMSKNNDLSCGSCHKQERSFADEGAESLGIDNIPTFRNTPNLNDLGWRDLKDLFWDFREKELHEMVLQPVLNEEELAGNFEEIISRFEQTNFYPDLFEKAFGTSVITEEKIGEALADFINAMHTLNSKYDQEAKGEVAFTPAEQAGKELFDAACTVCHKMNSFSISSTSTTVNNALDNDFTNDPGMGGWAGSDYDGLFRVPSLRNIELTAPYMHDGRFETLDDVLKFYNEDLKDNPRSFMNVYYQGLPFSDPNGYHFTPEQTANLKAFLLTLTDESFINDPKFSNPFAEVIINDSKELDVLKGIRLFPNPAIQDVIVTFPESEAEVILYDFHGRIINRYQATNGRQEIKRGNLTAGMYGISVIANGKQGSTKVVFKD